MNNIIATLELLLDGLEKKEEYLKDLLRYSKKQEEVLNAKEFDLNTFNNIIKNKQIRINNIQSIDDGFNQEYERIKQIIENNPDLYKEYILKLKKCVKSISELGIEITVVEHRNNDKFKRVSLTMKNEIKSFRTNKKAVINYYSTYQKQQKSIQKGFFDSKK